MNGYQLYRKAWRFDGPPHKEIPLHKKDWKTLLRQGGLLVRNTFDFDTQDPTSFWYVIKDQFNGMEELSSNERNKVRRSTKSLRFEQIQPDLLRSEGWPVLKATYEDYSVSDRVMNEQVFLRYLDHCGTRNYDYWGIFDQEKLIGFCTVWIWDEQSAEYGLIGILPDYKHNNTYPYYGLFYQLNEHYLGERHFRYVSDGARSITEHSHIQDFLTENFGFRKAYCHLKIHYCWWMWVAVRILYPFRKVIHIPQVSAVLAMEAMQTKP